jgi:hypothetical protein
VRSIAIFLLTTVLVFGAEDPWNKVRELPSGTEIRIYKRGAKQPVTANLDEAHDDSIVVATKKEQVSISKEDIDRIDSRPPQTGSRVKKETKTTTKLDPKGSTPTSPLETGVPSTSSSSSVTFGSKPDFETIYRRVPTK